MPPTSWTTTQPQTTQPASNSIATPWAQKSVATHISCPFNTVSELLTYVVVA